MMKAADKKQVLEKLSETPLDETPEEDLLFPPALEDRNSVIVQLVRELREDRDAKDAAIVERLHLAIAKEEVLRQLFAEQKEWVKGLAEKAESSGDLVGGEEAAKSLDLAPATLRYYAEQGIIPYFKMGRNRKYNLAEIKAALERAREVGKVSRLTDAVRKRLLR